MELAKQHDFYATVGCHPTRSKQFDQFKGGPEAYLAALDRLIGENLKGKGRVVAVGECGLGFYSRTARSGKALIRDLFFVDYDRTHFASPEVQKRHFREYASRHGYAF